jgi:N-acetylneuraminate synthase
MPPSAWREMVLRTHELEQALGETRKQLAANERETVVFQRRCLRAAGDLHAGTMLERDQIECLRPAPPHAIYPYELDQVLGRILRANLLSGDPLRWTDLELPRVGETFSPMARNG